MELNLDNIVGVLVDKWYSLKPQSIRQVTVQTYVDNITEVSSWWKFTTDNETFMFPVSEIKGIKING